MRWTKLFLFLFLLPLGAQTSWVEQQVFIYADADTGRFGVAAQRIPINASVYQFRQGKTLALNGSEGYLTAVTASTDFKTTLDGLLAEHKSITLGGHTLARTTHDAQGQILHAPIYMYSEEETGVSISFTLERPTKEILAVIDDVYKKEPKVGAIVKSHYQENYVIRIVKTNNFYSHQDPPTLYDALFAATLIGEKEQQLWGVHNGNDYLRPELELIQCHPDYRFLKNNKPEPLKTGQA